MCFILALFQVRPDYPLIVAANREERRDRPSTLPFRWDGDPTIWAGRDELAGGTWLGVSSAGMLAAITNRRRYPVDRALPSRGGLCVQALRQASPASALAAISAELEATRHNPFNLVCASAAEGWVTTWRGRTRALTPGIHFVTNRGEPDDSRLGVVRRGRALLADVDLLAAPLEGLLAQLGHLCADTGGNDPVCRPGGDRGTVSSSLIALDPDGRAAAYWHADAPPSEAPYRPLSTT